MNTFDINQNLSISSGACLNGLVPRVTSLEGGENFKMWSLNKPFIFGSCFQSDSMGLHADHLISFPARL